MPILPRDHLRQIEDDTARFRPVLQQLRQELAVCISGIVGQIVGADYGTTCTQPEGHSRTLG
jgi:hypothetical protein